MMEFSVLSEDANLERNAANPTIIKVIGCGGGGSSAVKRMIETNVSDVEFIVLNTDLQALNRSPAPRKLAIGQKLTGGLGAGGNPEIGESAAKEDSETIQEIVAGADMVIVTAGMGGGTGTGSIPIVADIARKSGALTIAVVTTPFEFEGSGRMRYAQEGLLKLRDYVDSLIVIPNQQVMKIIERKVNIPQAFRIADELLCQGVQGISEIITKTGDVNLDFNDVKSVMKDQGDALLGVGFGEGENRGVDAAQEAISNPLLENLRMDGASNILINITGGEDLGMMEVQEIVQTITSSASKDNHIFWGQVMDPSMEGKVRVTVIATGFNKNKPEPVVETKAPVQEPVKDVNVVDSDEFSRLLSGKGGIGGNGFPRSMGSDMNFNQSAAVTSSNDPFFAPKKEEEKPAGSSLGADLFGNGNFEQVKPSFQKPIVPPADYKVREGDINQPAVFRQTSSYGRTIDLSDD